MSNVICFDLEGPLSPQDNAYEVLGLAENGHKLFEVISKYDDVLTLQKRGGYEPGDTLKLITPFLLYHGITEKDIRRVSARAKVVSGAKETVEKFKELGWNIYIISTSYEQHAYNIGDRIGVGKEDIACTKFPLDSYRKELKDEDFALIENIEKVILEDLYQRMNERDICRALDTFFFEDLEKSRLGEIFDKVTVAGGQRKVDAAKRFAEANDKGLGDIVVVGDSITDYKMLKEVMKAGGLAIVFNGNEYALPYGNVALASVDQRFLLPIALNFMEGGKDKVLEWVKSMEENPSLIKKYAKNFGVNKNIALPYFHSLESAGKKKINEIIGIHKKMRSLVRGEAGKLG